jgi:hypothetical protein
MIALSPMATSVIKFTEAWLRRDALVSSPAFVRLSTEPSAQCGAAHQLCEIVDCHPTELSTPQNNRARAAAFSRRWRSRSQRYSSSAARSAAVTEAWVGTTHAVGQRVTPFVRMYSSMTVSQLASEIISIDVSLRTEAITGNASRLPGQRYFVTAAKLKPVTRQPPRWLPKSPERIIKPVTRKRLWSGRTPLRIPICRVAMAGAIARGY